MKALILTLCLILKAGLSAQAAGLTCLMAGRAPILELNIHYLENNQLQGEFKDNVYLPEHQPNTTFVGQLVPELSTSSTTIYKLVTQEGIEGQLEVNKTIASFPNKPPCPRCSVEPTFDYSAKILLGKINHHFSLKSPMSRCYPTTNE